MGRVVGCADDFSGTWDGEDFWPTVANFFPSRGGVGMGGAFANRGMTSIQPTGSNGTTWMDA